MASSAVGGAVLIQRRPPNHSSNSNNDTSANVSHPEDDASNYSADNATNPNEYTPDYDPRRDPPKHGEWAPFPNRQLNDEEDDDDDDEEEDVINDEVPLTDPTQVRVKVKRQRGWCTLLNAIKWNIACNEPLQLYLYGMGISIVLLPSQMIIWRVLRRRADTQRLADAAASGPIASAAPATAPSLASPSPPLVRSSPRAAAQRTMAIVASAYFLFQLAWCIIGTVYVVNSSPSSCDALVRNESLALCILSWLVMVWVTVYTGHTYCVSKDPPRSRLHNRSATAPQH